MALPDFAGSNVNPAILGWVHKYSVAIDYRQLLALKGMSYKSVSAAVPTATVGAAALHYTHFGDRAYNEQSLSIHYGLMLGKRVSIGAAVYYLHSGTDDGHYDGFNSATGSIGLQYRPTERLLFGAAVYNPFFVKRDVSFRVPVQMNVGAAYFALKNFLIVLELEKNIYDPLRLRLGAEYRLVERLKLQAGFATSPILYSIGVGYSHSGLDANVSVSVHQHAGITPGVTIGYSF